MLPEHPCVADGYDSRAFCGTYSEDGSIFISAVQGIQALLLIIILHFNTYCMGALTINFALIIPHCGLRAWPAPLLAMVLKF